MRVSRRKYGPTEGVHQHTVDQSGSLARAGSGWDSPALRRRSNSLRGGGPGRLKSVELLDPIVRLLRLYASVLADFGESRVGDNDSCMLSRFALPYWRAIQHLSNLKLVSGPPNIDKHRRCF